MTPLRLTATLVVAAVLILATWLLLPQAEPDALPPAIATGFTAAEVSHGEYVFHLAGCDACHTDNQNDGAWLAGGKAIDSPFGTFYAPNITPDPETGIGQWSLRDFHRSMRHGLSPERRAYFPAFPYLSYSAMADDDIRALYAYLRTAPAVRQDNREHDLDWYVLRSGLKIWRWRYFSPGGHSDADGDEQWRRGNYLATALGHCGECHTPRNALGALRHDQHYRGAAYGEDDWAPDISPCEAGLGDWSRRELDDFFSDGLLPGDDFVGSVMAAIVEDSLVHLTRVDRQALIHYLRTAPAGLNCPPSPAD
ncbi:MAG: c-type cytochrome [Wenzhouxiangellaceae bacterium]